jgi:phosphatidate phosphatase LPIN
LWCADEQNDIQTTTLGPHEPVPAPTDLHSLTQQPFGETERLAGSDDLGDVPNLDLNETPTTDGQQEQADNRDGKSETAHNSVFGSAASLLPSIPFISSRAQPPTGETAEIFAETPEARHRRHKSQPPAIFDSSLNGKSVTDKRTALPEKDCMTSDLPSSTIEDRSNQLSLALAADETSPQVAHRDDVVLDVSGYHSDRQTGASHGRSSSEVRTTVLDTFARDLLAAIPGDASDKRPAMTLRSTDPNIRNLHLSDISQEPETVIDDSSEDDDDEVESRRFDRAKSEPPIDPPNPVSPTLDPTKAALVMDYAWDWGRVPPDGHRDQTHPAPERRESLPPLESEPTTLTSARLRNVEENPYLFVFDSEGRSHTFELSLSEVTAGDTESISELAKQSTFLDHRITFQKFIESPQIVDDPRLVVRYSLQ